MAARDLDSLGICNRLVHIGREKEVPAPCSLDNLIETRLIDWQVFRVPSIDTGLVEVDNGDLDVGAGQGISAARARGRGFRKGARMTSSEEQNGGNDDIGAALRRAIGSRSSPTRARGLDRC